MVLLCWLGLGLGLGVRVRYRVQVMVRVSINLRNIEPSEYRPITVASNGYTSQCSAPYCSNPPFLTFLTYGHWRSVLSTRVPVCQTRAKAAREPLVAIIFNILKCMFYSRSITI